MREALSFYKERDGFRAFKIGWGPFGRRLMCEIGLFPKQDSLDAFKM
jgi:hypothetical protein